MAFADYWGFELRLCNLRPDERQSGVGVRYVKGNLPGREFDDRDLADSRRSGRPRSPTSAHGTTHQRPCDRASARAALPILTVGHRGFARGPAPDRR
jgi:hypothetical protein